MTLSIWRYSHLALAVSSFLFIALASLTGILLAFEPVSHSLQPHAVSGLDQITLSQTVTALNDQYDEIVELRVENRSVIADVINQDGDSQQIYIDPLTAKQLGEIQPKNEFFEWVRTLHRSLFLHGLGRIFMGITALLLFLIAFTGTILVVKRQRGLRRFFSKVVRDDFFSFYHVLFGRFWLLPILIISLSGMFLTLEGFEVFPKSQPETEIDFDNLKTEPARKITDFPIFKNTALSEVSSLEFPFSTDVEDPFILKTATAEISVNQITGEVLTENTFGQTTYWKNLSLDLHTGRSNLLWAMILAIAALNILFFIYSGFAMTLKRQKGKIRNRFKKEEAEFIILTGSENGSTRLFASIFHQSLIACGQKSFLAQLNDYQDFPSARHLVVFTATYGNGEAPANATKALEKIAWTPQSNAPHFGVVAFGSHAYPDFCRFGYDIFNTLSTSAKLQPLLEIATVNDKSIESVSSWANDFSLKTNLDLQPDWKKLNASPKKLKRFTVVSSSKAEPGQAFLIRIQPSGGKFTSGDLLNIYPAADHRQRQYSIGKVDGLIQLSVKRHENGLGSEFLHRLNPGDTILASVEKNPEFHLPKSASSVVLISNGTGIAPFLGMISENKKQLIDLYCGFRDQQSFAPYKPGLDNLQSANKLSKIHLALSREAQHDYVFQLLERDREILIEKLKTGTVFMLCGSLSMQTDVLDLLSAFADQTTKPLSWYQANGYIRMDCY